MGAREPRTPHSALSYVSWMLAAASRTAATKVAGVEQYRMMTSNASVGVMCPLATSSLLVMRLPSTVASVRIVQG